MALFQVGDTVAVDCGDNEWGYGELVKAGYSDEKWLVRFDDDKVRQVPMELIREDERDGNEEIAPEYDQFEIDPETLKRETRLERLKEIADQNCMEIHSEDAAKALESGKVPRYALVTVEGGHESNGNLTVHETKEDLTKQIQGEINEWPAWLPKAIWDLDTETWDWDGNMDYETKVEVN